jgi:hypothetical protein
VATTAFSHASNVLKRLRSFADEDAVVTRIFSFFRFRLNGASASHKADSELRLELYFIVVLMRHGLTGPRPRPGLAVLRELHWV